MGSDLGNMASHERALELIVRTFNNNLMIVHLTASMILHLLKKKKGAVSGKSQVFPVCDWPVSARGGLHQFSSVIHRADTRHTGALWRHQPFPACTSGGRKRLVLMVNRVYGRDNEVTSLSPDPAPPRDFHDLFIHLHTFSFFLLLSLASNVEVRVQVVIVCAVPQLASCHPEPVYLFIFASQPFSVISFTNIIPLAPLYLSHPSSAPCCCRQSLSESSHHHHPPFNLPAAFRR